MEGRGGPVRRSGTALNAEPSARHRGDADGLHRRSATAVASSSSTPFASSAAHHHAHRTEQDPGRVALAAGRLRSDDDVEALYAGVDLIGQTIEGSKVKYTWLLTIKGTRHKVEFFHSKISGKKRLILDGRVIYEQHVMRAHKFLYSWPLQEHLLSVVFEPGDGHFHLTINGLPFSYFTHRNRVQRNPNLAAQERRARTSAYASAASCYSADACHAPPAAPAPPPQPHASGASGASSETGAGARPARTPPGHAVTSPPTSLSCSGAVTSGERASRLSRERVQRGKDGSSAAHVDVAPGARRACSDSRPAAETRDGEEGRPKEATREGTETGGARGCDAALESQKSEEVDLFDLFGATEAPPARDSLSLPLDDAAAVSSVFGGAETLMPSLGSLPPALFDPVPPPAQAKDAKSAGLPAPRASSSPSPAATGGSSSGLVSSPFSSLMGTGEVEGAPPSGRRACGPLGLLTPAAAQPAASLRASSSPFASASPLAAASSPSASLFSAPCSAASGAVSSAPKGLGSPLVEPSLAPAPRASASAPAAVSPSLAPALLPPFAAPPSRSEPADAATLCESSEAPNGPFACFDIHSATDPLFPARAAVAQARAAPPSPQPPAAASRSAAASLLLLGENGDDSGACAPPRFPSSPLAQTAASCSSSPSASAFAGSLPPRRELPARLGEVCAAVSPDPGRETDERLAQNKGAASPTSGADPGGAASTPQPEGASNAARRGVEGRRQGAKDSQADSAGSKPTARADPLLLIWEEAFRGDTARVLADREDGSSGDRHEGQAEGLRRGEPAGERREEEARLFSSSAQAALASQLDSATSEGRREKRQQAETQTFVFPGGLQPPSRLRAEPPREDDTSRRQDVPDDPFAGLMTLAGEKLDIHANF
ncbi:hypothetical protein BESB_048230 [Besnoitia besnoiti]|uniref:Uncharacterized protein n=1 Tax=Besnoitia besnoiti TaxID=94643 RepID=A0A2A9MK41_BESBE|nr:hypothetical protein BESB_048230 [Besnoitia besnoiti]PFH36631.1 hypothetical protein BESB_048230 [Besnoitia besnoiti]